MKKKLTKEQLAKVESYAELQYTTFDVALICEIDEDLLLEDEGLKAFMRGRLRADSMARRANLEMAQEGNAAAMKILIKQAEESKQSFEKKNETTKL